MIVQAIGLLIAGLLTGFSIAAPIGPIGLLCIRRTLSSGRIYGLASGLGVATADLLYGSIAAFGLTVISSVLLGGITWLKLAGGLFLICLGVKAFLSKPAEKPLESGNGLASAYTSTLLLTLANPVTILSFTAVFLGIGLTIVGGSYVLAGIFAAGIFFGSLSWWIILCYGTDMLRARLDSRAMQWLNRGSGVIIAIFGLIALVGLWL